MKMKQNRFFVIQRGFIRLIEETILTLDAMLFSLRKSFQ